jgi:hypothetical protein
MVNHEEHEEHKEKQRGFSLETCAIFGKSFVVIFSLMFDENGKDSA